MTTEHIDITPTWEGILPLLVEVAVNGETVAARKEAMDELRKIARAADAMNAKAKAEKEQKHDQ